MNTLTELMSAITATFKTATGTGLDTLGSAPLEARVAEQLFADDHIPATRTEIASALHTAAGHSPREEDLAVASEFLRSFGWLA
ncbi:hypothetical protein [Corynebacterium sp.]|uniref:hypothetical protein n=1 Tax=Corynebacterium sp. TaxID=1720 RepID=UPI0026DD57C0|nr:hypothetical protein [Corynebacterium sp.]MDO5031147.1 hypothetical protein [Corynebacterium sp.]